MKKLAFSWHGPYRIIGRVCENAYRVAVPTHPDRVIIVNGNRLKRFRRRMSRPFPHEVPTGTVAQPDMDDDGLLTKDDLPTTRRVNIGGEETAFTGVGNAAVEVLA
ncbi:hypothetical protein PI125_g19071 [Phytophthora idaei]|nr:hypothetical protein PI125_g19071 [Phytophthora idaei]